MYVVDIQCYRNHSTGSTSPMDARTDTFCGGNQTPQYPPYTPAFDLDPMPPPPHSSDMTTLHLSPVLPQLGSPQPWPNQTASQQFVFPEPSAHIHPAFNEPIPSPPRRSTKRTKSKASSSRGPSYSTAEDKALCSAYLNVSRDPIVGAYQTDETYWERIAKYYNENNKFRVPRTPDSLATRWHNISKDTARFCGKKAEVDRRRESGKTEEDRVLTL
jgi:hypothetical protein